jgi:hypothetical protein
MGGTPVRMMNRIIPVAQISAIIGLKTGSQHLRSEIILLSTYLLAINKTIIVSIGILLELHTHSEVDDHIDVVRVVEDVLQRHVAMTDSEFLESSESVGEIRMIIADMLQSSKGFSWVRSCSWRSILLEKRIDRDLP